MIRRAVRFALSFLVVLGALTLVAGLIGPIDAEQENTRTGPATVVRLHEATAAPLRTQ